MTENSDKVVFVVSSTYGGERLGIQILTSIAREEGFSPSLYILDLMGEEDVLLQLEEMRPGVVAYSAMTYEHDELYELNGKLKSRLDFVSIFGGPHYTFNPEEIYSHEHIDAVCVGEGENAFRSFLKHIKEKTDYSHVNNLLVRKDGNIHKNSVGPLINNLDEIPFADRKIIPVDEKGYRHLGQTYSVMISRGCPFNCTYCFNSKYNQIYREVSPRVVRWRTVENIIAEMKQIKEELGSSLDYFAIIDDAINLLPKDYIYQFCAIYKKEVGLPFSTQFRADLIDEEVVRELKEAGMKWANCGIETGNEEVARTLLKRNLKNEQIVNAFRIFNKYGLKNFSQNMVGLPVEDPVKNALETIELNIKARVTYAHFTILLPYPKTPIEEYCRASGYLPKDNKLDKLSPSVFVRSILRFPNKLDNRRIDNLHKFASIAVRYPFLLPLIKLLIKLPPNKFFQYTYFLWYAYYRTVAPHNIKVSFSLITNGIKQVARYLKRHA